MSGRGNAMEVRDIINSQGGLRPKADWLKISNEANNLATTRNSDQTLASTIGHKTTDNFN